MTFRRRQRSKQHHAAHEGEQAHAAPLARDGIPLGDAEFIADRTTYRAFLDHLRTQPAFAFDTEFIGEVAYLPRTCLIQLASAERVALVDPFIIDDLQGLWELVGSDTIITIVHAGASDLSPVRRALGREPRNLIDVQVAAGFAGMPYPASLAKLIDRYLQFPLPKGHTFTDWDARPLTPSQLRYAADDVRYLPLVWKLLEEELQTRKRLPWAIQETAARLEDPHAFDASAHARRASRGFDLTDAQDRLLTALCVTRDEIARDEDMPSRSTIPDAALLEMVRVRPDSIAAIAALRGMPRPVAARHGDRLLTTLARHPSEPVEWFSVRKRREDDPILRAAIDAMLKEAHRLALHLDIAAQLVVSRADLERYVRQTLASVSRGESPRPLFAANDWRAEAFGNAIEAVAGTDWLGQGSGDRTPAPARDDQRGDGSS